MVKVRAKVVPVDNRVGLVGERAAGHLAAGYDLAQGDHEAAHRALRVLGLVGAIPALLHDPLDDGAGLAVHQLAHVGHDQHVVEKPRPHPHLAVLSLSDREVHGQ
eukprot:scaffold54387_cov41-Phaeocystis_antarctica.AAC.1